MQKAIFEDIRKVLIEELDKAKSTIKIAVAWFTNYELFYKLINKLEDGVNVELIIMDDYVNNNVSGLKFQDFIDCGGKLYYSHYKYPVHHKFCIIDDKVLINGSYNWTYFAESKNYENIIIFKRSPKLIKQFNEEFNWLINEFKKVDKARIWNYADIEKYDSFGVKKYLGFDLYYKAIDRNDINSFKEAVDILPDEAEIINSKFAKKLSKKKSKRKLKVSLGIEIVDGDKEGIFHKIIKKGSQIPIIGNGKFYTISDNQESVESHIQFGESKFVKRNKTIGKFHLDNLPLRKAGKVEILDTFRVDRNGILKVTTRIEETENQIQMYYDINHLIK